MSDTSSEEIQLRDSSEKDLEEMLEIYNDAVLNLTSTFDIAPQTLSERREWFLSHGGKYPLVTAELQGMVLGYCSISPFSKKAGYSPTVELSVYVRKTFRRRGIGKLLMTDMITRAKNLHYHAIISIIAQNNEASIKLHQEFGFKRVAHLRQVGYKFSSWQDVEYYELLF